MEHPSARSGAGLRRDDRRLAEARRQLRAYFAGELREFRLSLALQGTPFQRRVWAGLQTIPYGETISYAELARRIGRPKAGRAVGGANHRNPIAIIVPCHRVIGADGTLVGYGGGLERKKTLLALEARVAALLKT
ncbi:MAG: methylated-DNA--[protein]-cysteine S-methyltransferase [Planctomycetes bacterium]|nr:methylated-DNA--[protein]-cysteine S-methyltransferase [Planctomycetota bacterium]